MKRTGLLVLLVITLLLVSSCGKPRDLKGGIAVTVEGDTIEFYGGHIPAFTQDFNGHHSINMVIIKEKKK